MTQKALLWDSDRGRVTNGMVTEGGKLQALVYDILPSTTAVFSFVGAQTVVSVLQTSQIKQGESFIAANKVYTSTNKTTIV